jgi:hypothetical protein
MRRLARKHAVGHLDEHLRSPRAVMDHAFEIRFLDPGVLANVLTLRSGSA